MMTRKIFLTPLILAVALVTLAPPSAADDQNPSLGPDAIGRWRKAPKATANGELSPEQEAMIERLRSIGYVSGSVETSLSGVTMHIGEESYNGFNFYSSGHGPEAVLMNMRGRVLHRWRKAFDEIWPGAVKDRERLGAKWWRRVHLFPNGDILAIFEGLALIKIDKDSNLIWARRNGAHHDFEIMPNGDIYVLTREPRVIPWVHKTKPTLEDFLTILDSEGNEKRSISIFDAFRNSPYKDYVFQGVKKTGDVAHTNTVHVLDGSIADRLPAFRKGNVLTSMNALGVLAVLDVEKEALVWAHKSSPHGQHDPLILDNGHLLVFDNHRENGRSIVAEYAPATMELVWEYRGTEEKPFFSRTCGTAQRLPNGNTLITESDGGRAFEVTPDNRIVWEYYTPHRAGDKDEYIATLAEVLRLPPDFPVKWLKRQR